MHLRSISRCLLQHEPMAFVRGQTRSGRPLFPIGWAIKRQSGSPRTLYRVGWADFAFAFHDSEEIGPRMLTRIAKHTGLTPEDW